MTILKNREVCKTDSYCYDIEQGGKEEIKVSNGSNRYVTIMFEDGVLIDVEYSFALNFDLRSTLHIQAAVNKEVLRLEKQYGLLK